MTNTAKSTTKLSASQHAALVALAEFPGGSMSVAPKPSTWTIHRNTAVSLYHKGLVDVEESMHYGDGVPHMRVKRATITEAGLEYVVSTV